VDPDFQKLLNKAFQREPSLADWFDEFKRWEAVNTMILEELTRDPPEEEDVFA
jgi:hypothetical protein